MSSYNENLNASVVASLQAQELKLNNTQTLLNANMFTLYYAEDAKITAQEKLEQTEKSYSEQEIVNEEAVANNNIATNLLATANQEKEINLQSVSNTAVAAANVQIATNSITKLASDMGSIVSILNAADYGSQIYDQAIAVNQLMNDTAYNAEVTSQWAMDASSHTAEITAGTVAEIATKTATSITDLLTVLKSQLDATTSLQITENAALASAATAQKKAEGELIDSKVDYNAANASYIASNKELNLNLQVTNKSNSGFTVQFSPYLNPFNNNSTEANSPYNISPVESYYVFVVKESEESTFSLSIAEGLIDNEKIAIPISNQSKPQLEIDRVNYLDINGSKIILGENYVVFVMVQFTLNYKKSLNNFEDFLTAGSSSFILTNKLNSPTSGAITMSTSDVPTLTFNVTGNNSYPVAYRCMFLPDNSELINAQFSTSNQLPLEEQIIKEIKIEIENHETNNQNFDEDLESLSAELNSLIESQQKMNDEIKTPETDADGTPVPTKANADQNKQLDKITKKINALQAQIQELTANKNSSSNNEDATLSSQNKTPNPGFYFNQLIAENVTDGNYTSPNSNQITSDSTTTTVTLPLLENTTDNFGNPLIEGNSYVPVILSVATGSISIVKQYSNSLSDFRSTATFKYSSKSTTATTNQ
ncbi:MULTISPECIES: hypothetical protein [Flavobacterium]|uniref:Uncharacterized protein n=1 Tax=Flavobacterium jumunjinense TaxID=998845 RepID=A0ABV5GUC1_9FLAO|nr:MULTISPECIES: hypothetical protein [Flavobacterium]